MSTSSYDHGPLRPMTSTSSILKIKDYDRLISGTVLNDKFGSFSLVKDVGWILQHGSKKTPETSNLQLWALLYFIDLNTLPLYQFPVARNWVFTMVVILDKLVLIMMLKRLHFTSIANTTLQNMLLLCRLY